MWCKCVHAGATSATKTTDSTLAARAFSHARRTEITYYATVKKVPAAVSVKGSERIQSTN